MSFLEDKQVTMKEAIKRFVYDGCSITISGMPSRSPMAAVYEIIRQKKRNLTLVTDGAVDPGDLLVGAGCIKKFEGSYIWVGVVGIGYNIRRAREKSIPNYLEIEAYSNYTAGLRFFAGAMNIPFFPTKSLLGSDIPRYNPKIKIIEDPYGSGPIALVPASTPDVAIIHAQRVDKRGNVQIWGMICNDDNKARAAKHTIITCEEIIPEKEIRKIPNMTIIPEYCVDAIVKVPYGAHPTSTFGYYWMDIPFRRNYMTYNKTYEGFLKWLDEWVYSCEDHTEYCRKVGWERLEALSRIEREHVQLPL